MAEFDPYIIAHYQQLGNQTSNADMQTLADVALKRTQAHSAQYQLGRQQNLASIVSRNASAFSNPYAQALAQGGFGQEAYEAQVNALAMGQKILSIHRDITASRLAAAQTPEQLDAVISSVPADIHSLYGLPGKDATQSEKEGWRKSFLAGQITPEKQAELNKDRFVVVDAAGFPVKVDKTSGEVAPVAGTESVVISGPSLDAAARRYIQTGEMSDVGHDPGGRSRRAILARAEELAPGSNVAWNKAVYAADKASLEHLQPQADAVSGFIRTFDKNLEMLEESVKKLQSADRPALNKGLRWFQENVSGDPALTGFKQALSTVTSEAGKINSGSTGAGGVPISVMQEMEHNLPPNATPAQIVEALKVLRKDSENRLEAMHEQVGAIKGRLGGGPKDKGVGDEKHTKPKVKAPTAKNATAHPEAKAALEWARKNKNDPRAKEIIKRLGAK